MCVYSAKNKRAYGKYTFSQENVSLIAVPKKMSAAHDGWVCGGGWVVIS